MVTAQQRPLAGDLGGLCRGPRSDHRDVSHCLQTSLPPSLPFQAVLSLESHRDHLLLTPSAVPCVVKSSPLQKQMAPAQAPLVGMSAHHLPPVIGVARP